MLVLAPEEADGAIDDFAVLVHRDVARAGRVAEAEVVLEARAWNRLGHADIARAVGKEPVEELEGLAQGLGAGVGAEVQRAVLRDDSRGGDAG